jgi:hypothetical protein
VKELVKRLGRRWRKERGASESLIRRHEELIGVPLPDDYKEFLRLSNGGFGCIGCERVDLWGVEDLYYDNKDYEITEWLPGVVGIGTDGGDYAFAFDYRKRKKRPRLVRVPLGCLADDWVEPVADSFTRWLLKLLEES